MRVGYRPSADPAAAHAATKARIPPGRYGNPEEMAAPMLSLASDEASFRTGGVYQVDGGIMA